MRLTATVPATMLGGDVFTPEALASMVGQTPRLTVAFDWNHPLGKATVVEAAQDGTGLRLVIDVDDRHEPAISLIKEWFPDEPEEGEESTAHWSIGHVAEKAIVKPDRTREFRKTRLAELAICSIPSIPKDSR